MAASHQIIQLDFHLFLTAEVLDKDDSIALHLDLSLASNGSHDEQITFVWPQFVLLGTSLEKYFCEPSDVLVVLEVVNTFSITKRSLRKHHSDFPHLFAHDLCRISSIPV